MTDAVLVGPANGQVVDADVAAPAWPTVTADATTPAVAKRRSVRLRVAGSIWLLDG